jgi:hypothetical protein
MAVNHIPDDGIIARFGASIAPEDHAVRACDAALAMEEAIRRCNVQSHQIHHCHIENGSEVRRSGRVSAGPQALA